MKLLQYKSISEKFNWNFKIYNTKKHKRIYLEEIAQFLFFGLHKFKPMDSNVVIFATIF